ncbi:MAG: AAA family ATPase, partial [Halofilum sp. (in: g-proteobacteria)]
MTTAPEKPAFPFTAVVGQPRFKTALILASIAPRLNGVLVSGPRGCAKSTLARGLADLHPESSEHFVTLPLGATEEQLIGSLDLQKALGEQSVEFRPGLLAKAHGGVLYIDEVNLLPDPLVDSLLDVAASGVNRVERDGISHSHAAEFLLVGTMNPDEGELRPQLLDRFGLSVELHSPTDIDERTAIMRQRLAYEHDPEGFIASHADEQAELRHRLDAARAAYPGVTCPPELERQIAERCLAAHVDGVRADITWREAAAAHASWEGHVEITEADLDAVAELVLHHRRHDRDPAASGGGSGSAGGSQGESGGGSKEDAGDWGGMPPRAVSPAGRRTLPREAAAGTRSARPTGAAPLAPSAERGRGNHEGRQPNHRAAPDERR